MLKKARLLTHPTPARQDSPFRGQGRSERSGEEIHTALRVGRSPLQWVLANAKAPPEFPSSEKLLLDVEPLSAARTKPADFFSILLETLLLTPPTVNRFRRALARIIHDGSLRKHVPCEAYFVCPRNVQLNIQH